MGYSKMLFMAGFLAALLAGGCTRKPSAQVTNERVDSTPARQAEASPSDRRELGPIAATITPQTPTRAAIKSANSKTQMSKPLPFTDPIVATTVIPPTVNSSAVDSTIISGPSNALATTMAVPSRGAGLGVGVTVAHASGFKEGTRDYTQILAEMNYDFDSRLQLGVNQGFRKIYEIAPSGEEEFLVEDTQIGASLPLSDDFLGTKVGLSAGVTLPVSQVSRDSGHLTRTSLGVTIQKALFGDRLVVRASPDVQYCFNRYTTSASGVPLELLSFVQGLELDWNISSGLHLVAWGKGYYTFFEEYQTSNSSPAAETSYGMGGYLGYQFNNGLALQVGYVHRGQSVFGGTRFNERFYDSPETRRAYAAVSFRF